MEMAREYYEDLEIRDAVADYEEMKDDELIGRIVGDGDHRAFETIMVRYREKVWRLARGITRSDADTEDVVQEVFLTVYQKLDTFEGRASFSSWLYRIAANASYMKLRSRRSTKAYDPQDLMMLEPRAETHKGFTWAADPEQAFGSVESIKAITDAISKLPEKYRIVLNLRDIEEFSIQEIADMLGLRISAVKSRLHRARLYLRKRLSGLFDLEVNDADTDHFSLDRFVSRISEAETVL